MSECKVTSKTVAFIHHNLKIPPKMSWAHTLGPKQSWPPLTKSISYQILSIKNIGILAQIKCIIAFNMDITVKEERGKISFSVNTYRYFTQVCGYHFKSGIDLPPPSRSLHHFACGFCCNLYMEACAPHIREENQVLSFWIQSSGDH